MEQALALDQGYDVQLAAVQEVQGNFKSVDAVTYDGVPPVTLTPGEEEDTGTAADEPPRPRAPESAPRVKAKIREEADAEGSTAVRNTQPTRRAGFLRNLFR
jgi:hypothetical protein